MADYDGEFADLNHCDHPNAGDGPCDYCVRRKADMRKFREYVPTKQLNYADKLDAFNERFQQHPWWKRVVEGTPLSNDLACMAVESRT